MTRVENYELLLEKLKPKKSTGDCHTSDDFYDKAREQLLEKFKQFLETFEQEAKEAQDDRYTPDNICGIPRKGGEEKWKEHSMK